METQDEQQQIRRENLQLLIKKNGGKDSGGQAKVADIFETTPGYISQLEIGKRPITEKTARKFETRFKLSHLWMDEPHTLDEAPAILTDDEQILEAELSQEDKDWLNLGRRLTKRQRQLFDDLMRESVPSLAANTSRRRTAIEDRNAAPESGVA